jgi:hypothetical protein
VPSPSTSICAAIFIGTPQTAAMRPARCLGHAFCVRMRAMRQRLTWMLRKAALGVSMLCSLGCATKPEQAGESIEWRTGSKTGNPFEIRLTASGTELKAVLVNRSSAEQSLLHDAHLQMATLELVSSTNNRPKPYDSRLIMKYDNTPYCQLFRTLAPGKKLEVASVRFKKSREGYAGQWGPFNFDEVPSGDYQARVTWNSERAQCLDENTRQMRRLPTVWKGLVRSNQVTLHLP